MAGGYRVAPDGDFGVLVQRLERAERRLAELERPTGSQTAEALRQLNNGFASDRVIVPFVVGGDGTFPDAQAARTNFDAALLTFTPPPWATQATVLAFGIMNARGTQPSPVYFDDVRLRIGNVQSENWAEQASAPPFGENRIGGTLESAIPYITTLNASQMALTRTFATTSPVEVAVRITKQFTGAGAAFTAQCVATVFWSAP